MTPAFKVEILVILMPLCVVITAVYRYLEFEKKLSESKAR